MRKTKRGREEEGERWGEREEAEVGRWRVHKRGIADDAAMHGDVNLCGGGWGLDAGATVPGKHSAGSVAAHKCPVRVYGSAWSVHILYMCDRYRRTFLRPGSLGYQTVVFMHNAPISPQVSL